jgi:YidC/Oxa1 family membrane protein insertase
MCQKPSERKLLLKKLKKLVVTNETKTKEITTKDVVAPVLAGDTVQLAKLQKSLGDFAYSATLASAKESYTTIENKLVTLKLLIRWIYRLH